jgi:hypothetical protein
MPERFPGIARNAHSNSEREQSTVTNWIRR